MGLFNSLETALNVHTTVHYVFLHPGFLCIFFIEPAKVNYLYDFTCFRNDGGCKHVMALLLSLVDFVERHKNKSTVTGTDAQCKWDKPRHESRPKKYQTVFRRETINEHPKIAIFSSGSAQNKIQPKIA